MNLDEALNTLKENGFLVENEITDSIQNHFKNEVIRHREYLEKIPKGRLGSGKKDKTEEAIANFALKRTNEWVQGVIENAIENYLDRRDYEKIDWNLKLGDFFNDKTINDYENPKPDWTLK